jgi:RimJ/RimL family protein N-acetyltransferase
MTLATEVPSPVFTPVLAREAIARRIPVLKTDRLVLRALCQRDVPVIVQLAGDRRVAENTARIPHPYTAADAEGLLASINQKGGETVFALELDGALIGMSGLDRRRGRRRARLLAGRSLLGMRLRDRGSSRRD